MFLENHDADVVRWVTQLAQSTKCPLISIFSFEDAINLRDALKSEPKGIVLISTLFSRGYDLKMGADAFVLILANGTEMTVSQINQMLGRGNRS